MPFYLRSGKAMAAKSSAIVVEFQPPPDVIFNLHGNQGFTPNFLSICIQPDEGIQLRFETKVPDTVAESRSVNMSHSYHEAFPDIALPDAYERLLLDALKGDAALFARNDGIENAWRLMDPIIQGWDASPQDSPLGDLSQGRLGTRSRRCAAGQGRARLADGLLWTAMQLEAESAGIHRPTG